MTGLFGTMTAAFKNLSSSGFAKGGMPRTASIFFVLILAGMQLAFTLPDLWRATHSIGYTGFEAVGRRVMVVYHASPAEKAGIVQGDVVASGPPYAMNAWREGLRWLAYPDAVLKFTIERNGRPRSITLRTVSIDPYPKITVILRILANLCWALLATVLVLRRPSALTWSFFVFSATHWGLSSSIIAIAILPYWLTVTNHVLSDLLSIFGDAAGIIFVLNLGEPPFRNWRRVAGALLVPVFVCLDAPDAIFDLRSYFSGSTLTYSLGMYDLAVSIAATGCVLALLAVAYYEAIGKVRQRVAWVAAGIISYYAIGVLEAVLSSAAQNNQVLAQNYTILGTALNALCIITPICVAYAVLKHRLVDLNFVISRTLVYGTISLLVIALFGLIDWSFTKQLDAHGLGTVVEIVAATAIGFSFKTIHAHVDSIVDALFFTRRHQAEEHLQHVARALPSATSMDLVEKALIEEPLRTLELSSAALFRKGPASMDLYRERAEGWTDDATMRLASTDVLFMQLQAERKPLKLHASVEGVRFPRGAAMPELALPLFVDNELAAVCFYGAHVRGEHLDPDETRAISALAVGAEAAISQLNAQAVRAEAAIRQREIDELRREVKLLRSVLSDPSPSG